ncbi:YugN family protein [Bacillus horti]|uniref:YugN-like family protein n=1 Tax=Caldalkalibacillus horti TaxID=77523 RepID=A0ABT9W408_9BACI|nr:YugN family protein [Bacillus horti]MDQ0167855.1 hypothetical protein [Bacillus horti]
MKIEGTGLEAKEATLLELDHATEELGFVRWAWDYSKATYDLKYDDRQTKERYYLRVPAESIKGQVHDDGHRDSMLKLGTPYIGRYTHPHGMDYEYDFPKHILDHAKKVLSTLSSSI